MILGLDVGGTQTDGVLIDGHGVVAETKTATGDDLLQTLRASLDSTLRGIDPGLITRMVFSTTMATNAIVQDELEPAGMIVSAGPGVDPHWFSVGPSYHVVEGCLDHQGFEALPLHKSSVKEAGRRIRDDGIHAVGVVGKFSVRNPAHELTIADWVKDDFSHIAMGHHVSGTLNFPRRICTTYLNAALHHIHHRFTAALDSILNEKGLRAPRYLLKPDGGTFSPEHGRNFPARTAQSGPAASVMGALALDGCPGTTLVLDIGGTTTDMSVVLNGVPLTAPTGITLGPYPTLIRSLNTHSIGVGGDSRVAAAPDGSVTIGPRREGLPVAFGGPVPTPTDAMITLGLLGAGDAAAARAAMDRLGAATALHGKDTARKILETMGRQIALAAREFIDRINSRPVYTIHDVLAEQVVTPDSVVVIGGPAPHLAPFVGKALELPCRVPDHFGVANAVGAAAARVTTMITLQADTERGSVIIPEADIHSRIDHRFDMDDAIALATDHLRARALAIGADPDHLDLSVTEKQSFNMIRGFTRTGRNIRLKMEITPGLIPQWNVPATRPVP